MFSTLFNNCYSLFPYIYQGVLNLNSSAADLLYGGKGIATFLAINKDQDQHSYSYGLISIYRVRSLIMYQAIRNTIQQSKNVSAICMDDVDIS